MSQNIQRMFSDYNGIVKLEINDRKISEKKSLNIGSEIISLLNNPQIKKEIQMGIRTFRNENKTTTYQNLWHVINTILSGKFMALNVYIRREQKFRSMITVFTLKNQKKRNKLNFKKAEKNIRVEINKRENR